MIQSKKIFLVIISLSIGFSAAAQKKSQVLDPVAMAKKHGLSLDRPAPDFFDGALLGNGGMGVVVTTRPDAIVLRFGHNNVWDIRIAEKNREKLGTFDSVFDRVDKIDKNLANLTDDPWYNEYNRMSAENYASRYPRPFPCGSLVLGFDRRKLQLLGHDLDISNGLCRVKLMTSKKEIIFLKLFTDMGMDKLWMELVDKEGKPYANLFNRIKIIPDPSTPNSFPRYAVSDILKLGTLGFRQTLPRSESESVPRDEKNAKDRAFSLRVTVDQQLEKKERIAWSGNPEPMDSLEAGLSSQQPFLACVTLSEGLNSEVSNSNDKIVKVTTQDLSESFLNNEKIWKRYWSKSAVQLSDKFLEAIWYRNLYFFNCATKPSVNCPGLFANWSYNNIGTAWHGDYHMNYNTQQPFWLTFSSNHLEKNLSYVNLVESLMPMSRKWAKDYYQLPGAYFPHSAYPVEMTMNPYPIPDWGWEVSETPWTVQGLWWHYSYSGDQDFLEKRAYEPIKAAVEFLVAYMGRPDAYGVKRWKDEKYHIFPTVPPELYGLRPGFSYNYDCNVDLSLTKFAFNAFKRAVKILGKDQAETRLIRQIDKIMAAFPDYPQANDEEFGKIFVSVPGEHSKVVYNVPNALFAVFPGEDLGVDSDNSTFHMLQNTYRNQQNEGGNDLVFINFQAARIGMLDLEEFKRQVRYSLLPNGTATDMVMQTGGRYNDGTEFDYMSRMGIWFENFALPAVINECLLQGNNGKIRLFPNWPKDKEASFNNLRTVGAFLVSAVQRKGIVESISIISEKGGNLHIILPWKKCFVTHGKIRKLIKIADYQMQTTPGQFITFSPIEQGN